MSTSENLEVLFELEYIGYHMGYIIPDEIYIKIPIQVGIQHI